MQGTSFLEDSLKEDKDYMEFLNETFLTASGAVVLAIGGFALMRMRRHSIIEAACFAGGVLGMIGVLYLIKTIAF